jgi:dual specificity tyrosine-phosphorylation-regulated kinase 2/3/4
MLNDYQSSRNQRLKAGNIGKGLKNETKIPSIHKYKLSLDLKISPNTTTNKIKQTATRSGIKQSPESTILLSNREPNTSHRLLTGFFSSSTKKNTSIILESPYNSSNLLFNPKRQQKPKLSSISVSNLQETKFPMKGSEAIALKNESLTEYELKEILQYEEIHFIGNHNNKIHGNVNDLNWGYDDEEFNYKIVVGDHFIYRYEVLSVLGRGSFGQVCKCLDHKTSETVALKVIKNKSKFHKQGAIEVKILKHLNDNDQEDTQNIVRILNNFTFRSHLCIVFELLSINLYEFLKFNHFQGLTLTLVRCFAIQILIALKFSGFHNIIHCDLKPENILLRSPTRASIKVIDYGSSCFAPEQIYTYIQSRFYRAPEIMLGIPYTTAIDMWSYGCILLELYTGYPIFPGESENDQMLRIMEILGPPSSSLLSLATRKKHFFDTDDKPKLIPNSKGKIRIPGSRPLKDIIQVHDPNFLDLILATLAWDPRNRISAEQAAKHPWINENFGHFKKPHRKVNSFFNEEYTKAKFH